MDFTPLSDTHRNPRAPRPVAVEDIIRVGDLAIISGSWDTFKSTVALELAYSMATCGKFLNRFMVGRQLRTGILQAEIDPGAYDHRLLGFPPTDELLSRSDLGGERHFTFDHLPELNHAMDEYQMKAIVLDPIGQMWPRGRDFSPNLGMDISPIMYELKTMGKTVILVHHDPKPGQGLQNRASGSSSLLNDPDTRIFVDRKPNTDDITMTVRSRLNRSIAPFLVRFERGRLKVVQERG